MAAVKIDRFDIAKYRLPLARRFRAASVDTDQREGRLVRLTTDDGLQCFGEISPLPGRHQESMADVDAALARLGPELTGAEYGAFAPFAGGVADLVAGLRSGPLPSVVFGIQTAGLAQFAQRARCAPAAILSSVKAAISSVSGSSVRRCWRRRRRIGMLLGNFGARRVPPYTGSKAAL